MSEKPTPLINSSMLAEHAGQVVLVVGKVIKVNGTDLIIQTSDQGNVDVTLRRETEVRGEGYVEILGKVSDDGDALREFTVIDFGDNIDMGLVESAVQLTAKFPALFKDTGGDVDMS